MPPAATIACFLLLSEAMIGVAVTGERKWHASWWEWHGLIVLAYRACGRREGAEPYQAWCSSSYRLVDGRWRLFQHQQTPV